MADTNARPGGSASATVTDWAASGPLFVTVTVKVTLEPTSGVAMSTLLAMTRSASLASTWTDVVSFAGTGSKVVVVTVAVLVIGVWPLTRATTASVALAAFASGPIAQIPVAGV